MTETEIARTFSDDGTRNEVRMRAVVNDLGKEINDD